MPYYFKNLSPIDFQELGIDLLQKHRNLSLIESFKPGKDLGIDARYILNEEKVCVIQFKHYSEFKNLKSNLKQEELKKVEKLFLSPELKSMQVSEYVLVTSLGLTLGNKRTIREIIPYIKKDDDIYGRDELNNLLRQYPKVEESHFKLWLNSTAVLERVVNADIFNQTDFEKEDIQKKAKLYVKNGNIKRVEEKLKENNCCIISGVPGVGKTTLAKMLTLIYLHRGYELVVISRDIKEAYKTYAPNKKILYYYDDFLGTTFLQEALPKNEDSHLVKFIDKIKDDKSKKFILTTREYILQQALNSYEKIKHSDILSNKFVIELKQYNSEDKAKILFNHLYFSGIDRKYITNLQINRKYIDIVRHKYFNPRLIEFMTSREQLKNIYHEKYSDWCISNLNNPETIWESAFNNISQESKILCYFITVSQSSGCLWGVMDFRDNFQSFYKIFCNQYTLPMVAGSFDKAIKEIEDSFISVKKRNKIHERFKPEIEFINPSVSDFMESLIKQDDEIAVNLILASNYSFQVQKILEVLKNSSNDELLLNILCKTNAQRHILHLTKKDIVRIDKRYNTIFSFIFNSISNNFFNENKDFSEKLLLNLTEQFISPMSKSNIAIDEGVKCLEILEQHNHLYFTKKEEVLEKSKRAFCQNIDVDELMSITKFIGKFESIFTNQEKKDMKEEVQYTIEDWYNATLDEELCSEEIRSIVADMHEVEEMFDVEEKYSIDLDKLADEKEDEEKRLYQDDSYDKEDFIDRYNKKDDDISDRTLDVMFNKLY